MKKTFRYILLILCIVFSVSVSSQNKTLSLQDCLDLALSNNKQIATSKVKEDMAKDAKNIAKTMYLPKVDMTASYVHTSKEVSLLNSEQKESLTNIGTTTINNVATNIPNTFQSLKQLGLLNDTQIGALSQMFQAKAPEWAGTLNGIGQDIVDAFRTDTRNIWVGGIEVIQPLYTGGKITALNEAADISQRMAENQTELLIHNVTNQVNKAYWLVVSLRHKQALANKYFELITELCNNVDKMYKNGIATKADVLNICVKKNEAEMQTVQVDNGLALARMALCQVLGIPLDSQVTLSDENTDTFSNEKTETPMGEPTITNRTEIKMLDQAIDLSKTNIKLARSSMLPTIALSGGYTISNPNVFNGFQKKFGGMWNIGVILRMPVWQWHEPMYKIHAAKSATQIAQLEREDAMSLINLQINQAKFKVNESQKKVQLTEKNIKSAEENLRCATIGYREGIIPLTTVNEAQTAWFKAKVDYIDAEITLKTSLCDLKHALGE